MIFGLSGPNGAGKGEVVDYLAARSFSAFSLSDVIRADLRDSGLAESRERMIERGRALRAERGASVLADLALEGLRDDRNHVIDSIRHPAEVEALRASGQPFKLLWIDADIAVRFERVRKRNRDGDPKTLSQLRKLEQRELESDDPEGQQLLAVKKLADFEIRNEADLDSLHATIRQVFERSLFFERPSWDEYFMNIARVAASRSNCVKRKVAAIVTLDRRIISTGYNGTPRGTKNCNEGGCPRCNGLAPGGTGLGECFCSHGEENAISQAAYHGVSLRGSTIYTTYSPCLQCTKLIINAGLREVVYNAAYPLGEASLELLVEAGVAVRKLSTDVALSP
jgi:dCMP deaminase